MSSKNSKKQQASSSSGATKKPEENMASKPQGQIAQSITLTTTTEVIDQAQVNIVEIRRMTLFCRHFC
jgi:hypothetical protein